MLLRVWRGWTTDESADEYETYMREVAVPAYTRSTGHRCAVMGRRALGDGRTEFLMATTWDDKDAVRAFAAGDGDRAVFFDRDDEFLIDREWTASHYAVYASSGLETA
jgi:heme-degrading monooxygenase HmoA